MGVFDDSGFVVSGVVNLPRGNGLIRHSEERSYMARCRNLDLM